MNRDERTGNAGPDHTGKEARKSPLKATGAALQKALIIKYAVLVVAMALVFWLVAFELKVKEPFIRVGIYFLSALLLLWVGNRMDVLLAVPELSQKLERLNQEDKKKGDAPDGKDQK